jgi:hypothetical protein
MIDLMLGSSLSVLGLGVFRLRVGLYSKPRFARLRRFLFAPRSGPALIHRYRRTQVKERLSSQSTLVEDPSSG